MTPKDIFSTIPKETKLNNDEILKTCCIDSPLGKLIAVGDDDYLYLLQFEDSKKLEGVIKNLKDKTGKELVVGESDLLLNLKSEMTSYFEGKIKELTTPIKFIGTDFQKECWTQLGLLGFGETLSYGQLASRMGRNTSHSRAVGSAAGANPLVIAVPCHRLIASGGKQGGFSCGLDRKTWLLQHEKKYKI